jgi:hypothetical protein
LRFAAPRGCAACSQEFVQLLLVAAAGDLDNGIELVGGRQQRPGCRRS